MHRTIKLIADWSKTSINFLDVTVPIAKSIIETDLYGKPTDSHQYLSSSSCHPFLCKKGFFHHLFFHLPIIYLSLAISFFYFIFHLFATHLSPVIISLLLSLLLLSFSLLLELLLFLLLL